MTPLAASRPKALPPDRTIAFTFCTWLTGLSRSVSRVPGAPPRTSTLATAPVSVRITVHPVGRSVRVKWPTLIPGTAVRPLSRLAETDGDGDGDGGSAAAARARVAVSVSVRFCQSGQRPHRRPWNQGGPFHPHRAPDRVHGDPDRDGRGRQRRRARGRSRDA